MKKYFLSVACLAALSVFGAGSVVRVEGGGDAWRLTFDGKPYFIRGAGGGASKELLAKRGGNSFRTWGAGNLKEELDEAKRLGLTVMAGHWLGHAEHGFKYTDAAALERAEREVLARVKAHKDHPALLCWALGNEMEMNNPHRPEMWRFIDRLAAKVKAVDPNHPVCTVIAEIPKANTDDIKKHVANLDFIGINSYGGCPSIGARWRKAGMTIPYVVTEFGARGSREGPKDPHGIPLEQTSTEKGAFFAKSYADGVEAEKGKMCLGSYAFTWGWKVEATPTWHGMLLPDQTELASAQAVYAAWGVKKVGNRCPSISPVETDKIRAAAGGTIAARATATDPDGDWLTWKWVLLSDTGDYDTIGLGLPMPEGWEDAIVEGQGTPSVKVKLPGGGVYRLYAYCFDGKGHGAYANVPLHGAGEPPKRALKPRDMPVAVYKDGAPKKWHPSGYMGNTGALRVDEACAENPHSGATCMKIEYRAEKNWAGIYWQDPPNDWGKKPGGANLGKADMLVFWARGEKGGEKVCFWFGGLKKAKYPDTANRKLEDVVLKKTWTRYRIPLDGLDMSCIKSGFGFNLGGQGKPFAFYLDDIEYVGECLNREGVSR